MKEILAGAVKVVFSFLGAGCAAMGPMVQKSGMIDPQSIIAGIGAGSVAVVALYMKSPKE